MRAGSRQSQQDHRSGGRDSDGRNRSAVWSVLQVESAPVTDSDFPDQRQPKTVPLVADGAGTLDRVYVPSPGEPLREPVGVGGLQPRPVVGDSDLDPAVIGSGPYPDRAPRLQMA